MGYKYELDEILEVGYDQFRRNGYHNVGINQILKHAGIPKGSFYNFFESKEDFAQKVVIYYGEMNSKWIQNHFNECSGSFIDAIISLYTKLIDINEDDKFSGGCLVHNMKVEVGHNIDKIGHEADLQFLSWLKILSQAISKGQADNQIITSFTSYELAEYCHSGFYGALSRAKVTRSRDYMDKWLAMTKEFLAI